MLTPAEIAALPDRELDSLIAEARGWTNIQSWKPNKRCRNDPGDFYGAPHFGETLLDYEDYVIQPPGFRVPPFTTDWSAAGPLLEEMRAHLCCVWTDYSSRKTGWQCSPFDWGVESGPEHQSPTRAIAEAYLAWRQVCNPKAEAKG